MNNPEYHKLPAAAHELGLSFDELIHHIVINNISIAAILDDVNARLITNNGSEPPREITLTGKYYLPSAYNTALESLISSNRNIDFFSKAPTL